MEIGKQKPEAAMPLSRKKFLQYMLAGAGTAALSSALPLSTRAGASPAVISRKPPNILLIMTDQERAWHLFPKDLAMPNRRKLADSATVFTNYHVETGLCGPSRATIYSGQHVTATKVFDNPGSWTLSPGLDPGMPTLGTMLKTQGYHTAYKGKWHLGYGETPTMPDLSSKPTPKQRDMATALQPFGFDVYLDDNDLLGWPQEGFKHDLRLAEETAQWLLQNKGRRITEQPWFLAVNLVNPHDIMWFDATGSQTQQRFQPNLPAQSLAAPQAELYQEDLGYGLPVSFPGDRSTRPEAHRVFDECYNYFLGPIPHDNKPAWHKFQNYYFNCMRDVDEKIGIILNALESSGAADRTVVIYTSDHGELAGVHGHREKGPFIYPENNCVPLAIRHPDVRSGNTTGALASSVDLAPTLLSCAGINPNKTAELFPDLSGIDLSESLAKPGDSGKRLAQRGGLLTLYSATYATNPLAIKKLFRSINAVPAKKHHLAHLPPEHNVQFEIRQFQRACFDGRYRFARYFSPANHHRPETWRQLISQNDLELYDTAKDPNCLNNLALNQYDNKPLLLRMNALLNRLIQAELGEDDGSHMPGNPKLWTL